MTKNDTRKTCVSSVVLGIVGIVFSLFVPAVSYSCSITGLVFGIRKRKTHKCSAGIALNIVAISIAAINSICGILMTIKMFCSDRKHHEKVTEDQQEDKKSK